MGSAWFPPGVNLVAQVIIRRDLAFVTMTAIRTRLKRNLLSLHTERRLAGEQLVKNGPQRVNVSEEACVVYLARSLFGRHVRRRSHDSPGTAEVAGAIELLGESEIGDLGNASRREKHNAGLRSPLISGSANRSILV